eukprot:29952-Pelagococcus_subviridis.AAC.4
MEISSSMSSISISLGTNPPSSLMTTTKFSSIYSNSPTGHDGRAFRARRAIPRTPRTKRGRRRRRSSTSERR